MSHRTVGSLLVLVLFVTGCVGGASRQEVAVPTTAAPPYDRPATVARITCRGTETELETPTVRARRAGVHVEVTNLSDEPVAIYGLPLQSGEGFERHVVDVKRGVVKVACIPSSLQIERFEPQGIPLEIVGPRNL